MRSISISRGKGFSRRTTKEFVQFLFIAKGSVAEVQSQLYVALDQCYIGQEKFDELYSKSYEASRLISDFIQFFSKRTHLGNSGNLTNSGKPND